MSEYYKGDKTVTEMVKIKANKEILNPITYFIKCTDCRVYVSDIGDEKCSICGGVSLVTVKV